MYFLEFESYKQAIETAKSFHLVVDLVGGGTVQSSTFPVDAYADVMSDISNMWEVKTMFSVWDRSNGINTITVIPYEQIKHIRVVFSTK